MNHINKDERSGSTVDLAHEAKGHVEFVEPEHPRELEALRPDFAAAAAEDGRLTMIRDRERESNEAFGRKI